METNDDSLERFLRAQLWDYETALKEISSGRKMSHWMWYIFPQMRGLGLSENATYYGIKDLEEAKEYLNHPVLGARLREMTTAFLQLSGVSAKEVLGHTDAMKMLSCMTLFNVVTPNDIFQQVIEKYYNGRDDRLTLILLKI
jgi:uncharacterized protein (DUF1810 family)